MGKRQIKVGIIGLGRSGYGIHARLIRKLPDAFRIAAVYDPDTDRRETTARELECAPVDAVSALVAHPEVDVVVVASPNNLHVSHAIQAMNADKHAIIEKPVAMNPGEYEQLAETAKSTGKRAIPFQNRRYEKHFQKVCEIIASGVLGRIHLVRLAWHGFGRRWDWQTLKQFGGGLLNNNGPHVLDHATHIWQLLADTDPVVFADLRNVISLGDCEDHAKVILHPDPAKTSGASAPVIDIELSSAILMGQDRWMIAGSAGGLKGTPEHLEWRWVDWSKAPERKAETTPTADRSYNSEKLDWNEAQWDAPEVKEDPGMDFYRNAWKTLTGDDEEADTVTLESIRLQVAVQAQCRKVPVRSS